MKMDPMKVATIGLLAELPELLGTEEEAKRGAKVALVLDLVRLEFRGHHTKGWPPVIDKTAEGCTRVTSASTFSPFTLTLLSKGR